MADPARALLPTRPGDIVAGKYRVERVLGAGGMGIVVAARHLELEQQVALKFIASQSLADSGQIERFMREARAAVRLKSEHVARVYDVGRDQHGQPFMVLELLEGMDLGKLHKKCGPVAVEDVVEYVVQACEALVEAHSLGLVHRDLKPQNLFVTRRLNGTALVKVLDFGIAKAIGPAATGDLALTDSAAIIGSPLYMAPEQMRSARNVDVRTDIWALGVVLYELIGGKRPFDGETMTEVCIRVVNEAPPDLHSLRPNLDPALVSIVMRCLRKAPEQRWHNVAALAAALEPFSRGAKQNTVARPWRSLEATADPSDARAFEDVSLSGEDADEVGTASTDAGEQRLPLNSTSDASSLSKSMPFVSPPAARTTPSRAPLLVGGGIALAALIGVAVAASSARTSSSGDAPPEPLQTSLLPRTQTSLEGTGIASTSADAGPAIDTSNTVTPGSLPNDTLAVSRGDRGAPPAASARGRTGDSRPHGSTRSGDDGAGTASMATRAAARTTETTVATPKMFVDSPAASTPTSGKAPPNGAPILR